MAGWFMAEWPAWYGAGGAGDVHADLAAFSASESALPVGMLAFIDGQPLGTGALKRESIASHAHLSPWAAAGFVLPRWRRLATATGCDRRQHGRRVGCGQATDQAAAKQASAKASFVSTRSWPDSAIHPRAYTVEMREIRTRDTRRPRKAVRPPT
ncbi:MAG: hypothetical protein KF788_05090 [Piscinibacter sp.]|nr:hypothetical protein [Piscinibacter sp.]